MKLLNKECLRELKKIKDNSIDHSFTSPPYNRKRNDKYSNYNDDRKDWFEFNCNVIDELLRITKKYVFYNLQANYYNRQDVYKIIGKYNNEIRDIIIWEKSNPMPASGNAITNSVEYFLVLGKENLSSNRTYTKNIITTSVNSNMPKLHKAVMNQDVSDYFINTFTKQNETVIDCFMGLGTTGISCKKLNRDFIGIELDKEYFNIAKDRIENVPDTLF